MKWFVGVLLLVLSTAAIARPNDVPVVRVADPKSLENRVTFGPPDLKIGPKRGEIFWRIDVDLPSRTSLRSVRMSGYAPVELELSDGRCFQVDMESGGSKLTSTRIGRVDCSADKVTESPWPLPKPRAGLTYLGRSWDLDAWSDPRARTTYLFDAKHQDHPAFLKTDMRVRKVGALGCPDCPATEVTLVGYVGRQLTLATVMLYYP